MIPNKALPIGPLNSLNTPAATPQGQLWVHWTSTYLDLWNYFKKDLRALFV